MNGNSILSLKCVKVILVIILNLCFFSSKSFCQFWHKIENYLLILGYNNLQCFGKMRHDLAVPVISAEVMKTMNHAGLGYVKLAWYSHTNVCNQMILNFKKVELKKYDEILKMLQLNIWKWIKFWYYERILTGEIPCRSSSENVAHEFALTSCSCHNVLFILFRWLARWEVIGHTTAVLEGTASWICWKQHVTSLCCSHRAFSPVKSK